MSSPSELVVISPPDNTSNKRECDVLTDTDGEEGGVSGLGEIQTDTGGCIIYKMESKVKDFVHRALPPEELAFSMSPDSGTDMTITAPAERRGERGGGSGRGGGGGGEMEPIEVSNAREEMAMLVAVKQRLEAQHKRMEKMLAENRASIAETKEVKALTIVVLLLLLLLFLY